MRPMAFRRGRQDSGMINKRPHKYDQTKRERLLKILSLHDSLPTFTSLPGMWPTELQKENATCHQRRKQWGFSQCCRCNEPFINSFSIRRIMTLARLRFSEEHMLTYRVNQIPENDVHLHQWSTTASSLGTWGVGAPKLEGSRVPAPTHSRHGQNVALGVLGCNL